MANVTEFPFVAAPETVIAPLVKTNQLAVAHLEKLIGFYQGLLPSYTDLGLARLKAAAEVTDVDGLKAFVEGQVAATQTLNEKLVADSKALIDLVNGFATEYQTLAQDSVADLTPKAPKASKKAA